MATITASEFATELGTDSKTARRFLRTAFSREQQPGKGSQWAIEKRSVRSLKSQFSKWQAAQEAAKAERLANKKTPVGDLPDVIHVPADSSKPGETEEKYTELEDDFDAIVAEVEEGADFDA